MTDQDALLAAVCANPDDDTPRLALADWLDENNQPRPAAYIRARVELHRRSHADTAGAWMFRWLETLSEDGLERIDWSAIDADLAAAVAAERTRAAKVLQLPKLPGVVFSDVERGFPNRVRVNTGATFLRHARSIFRAAPVTRVLFESLSGEEARDLVVGGHLVHIRGIDVWTIEEDEHVNAIQVLGAHPDAAGVRELCLEGSDASEGLADVLAAGKHWTGLRRLELQDLDLEVSPSATQINRLFRKPVFSGLRELVAYGNSLDDTAARAIAAGGMPELRFLDIAINDITGDGAMAIARSKGLPNLRFLDLATNEIRDPEAVAALIVSPKLPLLNVLRLDATNTPGPDPRVLERGPLRGPGLRVLHLGFEPPSATSMAALAACPSAQGLWALNLTNAQLSTSAIQAFLNSAAFDALTILNLERNQLRVNAARAIANWSGAASLQWLGLHRNPLTANGIAAIAASPHLNRIRHISVGTIANSTNDRLLKKRFGKGYARM